MTLAIHLFGHPKLLTDSGLLPFNAPPKTLPLLAYLLMHRTQMLNRQQIAFALWPDDTEAAARANLRRHLHHLQRALPPAPADRPWLLGDARTVGWNQQANAWLDVAEFENQAASPATLAAAVQLYTGDLLETVYDEWIFFERERLRDLYLASLSQLVFWHRTRREYSAAIGFAQQILARDPFREDALRQLVALRYESGDRAGAIREYDTFEHCLRREMGIDPMPETQALHKIVLRNARLPTSSNPTVSQAVPKTRAGCTPELPFVGRSHEMASLSACWSRAAQGHGGLVLISGEAGVGKTRLVRELALQVEQQGGRVFYGSTPPGGMHPYQPVLEILQAALPLLSAIDHLPHHLAALSTLVPEMATRSSGVPLTGGPQPSLDPDRQRTCLFDSIAICLARLAEPRPVLVLLEDLHWASLTSVALLEFITRQAAKCPLLLVGTYRDEETQRQHPLRALRRSLKTGPQFTSLPLPRLSPQAVKMLVSQFSAAQPQFAQHLYELSEGNPRFIEFLWQASQGSQGFEESFGASSVHEGPLPNDIGHAILQRLEQLSPHARAYAEVAAVFGPSFDAEVTREVGGWDEGQADEALRELLDCRLLHDTESRSCLDYAFTHHLISTTLYRYSSPTRRRRRHRRAAEVLESLYPDRLTELAGELAAHYDRGGVPALAIRHYLIAARRCQAVHAEAEAQAALQRALHLAGPRAAITPNQTPFELLLEPEIIPSHWGEHALQFNDLQRLDQRNASTSNLKCEVLNC